MKGTGKMKKTLSLIMIVSMIFSALMSLYTVHAEEVIKNGVRYALHDEEDEPYCTVESPEDPPSGNVLILSEVTIGGVTYPVKSIAPYAFYDCNDITEVSIPGGIEEIGAYAFYSCNSLQNVILEEGVKRIDYCAFETCVALASVNFPLSLEYIGSEAFYGSGLLTAAIRSNVSYIGYSAFARCEDLKTISVASGNKNYKSSDGVLFTADGKCILTYPPKKTNTSYAIPEGVEEIDDYAFSYNKYLQSVTFPSTLTDIGNGAFIYSTALKTVTLPASLERMGGYVFNCCSSLTRINVAEGNGTFRSINGVLFDITGEELIQYPSGKTSEKYYVPAGTKGIGYESFFGNENIKQVVLPDGLEYIGGWAFESCVNLTAPTLPDSLNSIGSGAFGDTAVEYEIYEDVIYLGTSSNKYFACIGAYINRSDYTVHPDTKLIASDAFSYFYSLEKVVLPEGLEYIGYSAFSSDYNLVDINLPSTVKEMGSYAFYGAGVKSLTVPGGLGVIYNDTFEYSLLEEVVIEEGVTMLESSAFNYCSALRTVTIPASMTRIGYSAFGGCSALETVYYGGSKAQWEELTKDLDGFNQPLKDANVIFAVTALLGDVTGDGKINNKDVVALFRYVSSDETGGDPAVYDLTGDGKINNKDVVALFRYVSSL